MVKVQRKHRFKRAILKEHYHNATYQKLLPTRYHTRVVKMSGLGKPPYLDSKWDMLRKMLNAEEVGITKMTLHNKARLLMYRFMQFNYGQEKERQEGKEG